ncbi:hypothetical protein E3T55_07330 [Cryobacterium frigoriphilum]|uniref:DUF4190 domain-containing protein n=1 Tax=Cryobacterium frigoriphilum TaxID=1259150 RepID=A0A4R9A497_9MICO|nr:hypothetical protein [Cryobacterium frigoriphilum]TFD51683.1 hypothetical protein E3T55_07330 [Cryobacterium frigoriphilum]
MSGQHRDPSAPVDDYDLTRPPAITPEGQLAWEATETAPTEWVPYVYTEAEVRTVGIRRRLSVSSVVLGILGLIGGVLGVFGLPFALGAVVLALTARAVERRAGAIWLAGLLCGSAGLLLGAGWLYYITQVLIPGLAVAG